MPIGKCGIKKKMREQFSFLFGKTPPIDYVRIRTRRGCRYNFKAFIQKASSLLNSTMSPAISASSHIEMLIDEDGRMYVDFIKLLLRCKKLF